MGTRRTIGGLHGAALAFSLAGVLCVQGVIAAPRLEGDFLASNEDPYPSYALDRYISYNAMRPSRGAVYDRLGQFVSYGGYGLRWSEIRDEYTQEKMDAGIGVTGLSGQSVILQESNFFNFLAVARQNYGGEYMSMTLGRNLASSFSPMVLSHMMYGGLRVDYGSPGHDLTFLLSRGGTLEAALVYSRMRGDSRGFEELSPVIVTGANWRGHFGALDLGASFLRQIQSNTKSKPGSLVHGDVPYPEFRSPKVLKVRITDDSPRDLGGVVVYDADIYVRGILDSAEVHYTSAADAAGAFAYRSGLEPNYIEGSQVGGRYSADGASEQIVVAFDLESLYSVNPDLVLVEAEVELMIEGDYRIGVRQDHDFEMPDGSIESRTWPFTPTGSEEGFDQFRDHLGQQETYYTVVRSDESPATGAGPKAVRFRHAIPTAQSFYGLNVNLLTDRFTIAGELVLNPQDFKFPTENGDRETETAKSGYLTLVGRLGDMGDIGAEAFRVEPTYGGWYDSRRGGLVLHTDVRDVQGGVANATGAMTQEFRLYDDNDDHDNWPDDAPGSSDLLYLPRGMFERPIYPSSRPEGGVYPGLDMDGDLIIDHDRNRNAVEDYLEPFFGYDSDPPEFVFGQDLNNNLVPDFRENDDLPDYPYRRDQQGLHLFYNVSKRPWWLDPVRLGWYRSEEIVGGHEMNVKYATIGLRSELPELWVRVRDEIKRVRDDIPDDVYRVIPIHAGEGVAAQLAASNINKRYNLPTESGPPPADSLPMRNSLVNTAHVDSRWMPWPGVHIGNTLKYAINRKSDDEDRDGNPIQQAETLHNFSMVNKASISRELSPGLDLTVRVKHLLAKWDEGSYVPIDTLKTYQFEEESEAADGSTRIDTVAAMEGPASWSLIAPELLLSYSLTPRTRIEFGQHGLFLPFLCGRFIDREIPANGYRQNVSLLQLTMHGTYGGYGWASNVGLRRVNVDVNARDLGEDTDFTAFFVDVVFSPESE